MKSMYVQWLWWENWIWSEHGPCLLLGWQPLHWWDVGLELIGPEPEPGVSKGFPVPNGFHHLIRGRCVAWGAGIRALTKWISPVCDGNFWIILSHDQGIRAWGCTSQLVLCAKGFLGGSVVKKKKKKKIVYQGQETQVWLLGQEGSLKQEMATRSSTLAWEIPWIEEPCGLQSMGSQKSRTQLNN